MGESENRQFPPRSVNIRPADLKDFPRVMMLIFEYLAEFEGKGAMSEDMKERVRANVWLAMRNENMTILVAESPKHRKLRLVGYGAFDVRANLYGELIGWGHQLYVQPPFRSLHVADAILVEAERAAAKFGVKEFYIDTPIPKYFREKFKYRDKYQVIVKQLEA